MNAWLGGFESILKRMTPSNFDWFLHAMLFYHTRHVIEKQESKGTNQPNQTEEEEDEDENEGQEDGSEDEDDHSGDD